MRISFPAFCLFFLNSFVYSQNEKIVAFTINEGLPSNHIYSCIEDNKGFLWIATDAGVARFDGKHFQIFTTENGLSDNEVLEIVKEQNGTIWINSFKQSPAYFDEAKNKFIVAIDNFKLNKLSGTTNMSLFALPDSGVVYHNENGSFIFYNKKLDSISSSIKNKMLVFGKIKKNEQWFYKRIIGKNKWRSELIYKNILLKKTDHILLKEKFEKYIHFLNNDDKLYLTNLESGKCFIYSNFKSNPLQYQIDSIDLKESISYVGALEKYIYFTTHSGEVKIYSKQSLKFERTISGNYLANNIFIDSKQNTWVATVDKGLIVYTNTPLNKIQLPIAFQHNNFLSIAKKADTILAGTYYGSVVAYAKNNFQLHQIIEKKPSRQRKIIVAKNDIFSISEDGIYVNYITKLNNPQGLLVKGKTGLIYNDTLLLIGNVVGIQHINLANYKCNISTRFKRVICLSKSKDGKVYYGSTDGLYTYDVNTQQSNSLQYIHPKLSQRIVAITITQDSLIWVATANNGVLVLKKDSVIRHITTENGLASYSAKCMAASELNQVWIGTSAGISKIKYQIYNKQFQYKIQNLTITDGLPSNEINEMIYSNDTMYIATSNGIGIVPKSILIPQFNIPVYLIDIKINQQTKNISDKYDLDVNEQNIQMNFAAVELSGHFKKLQYKFDNQSQWLDLNNMTLSLQLTSGDYKVLVRALDVNGNISNEILKLRFIVATPIWKKYWFWIIILLMSQFFLYLFVNRIQINRRNNKMAKELATVQTAALEQQAFTSLMNPHFIFNALNSIQNFINKQDRQNANRYLTDFASLIRKNFEGAQESFIALEQEIENLKIYFRLEQMRFENKFSYTIEIDDKIDLDEWMIPSMMLQPLIENSLLHGIMNSAVKGQISIHINLEIDNLRIVIVDNGIGIDNSKNFNKFNLHKSRGMGLILKRIQALNQLIKHPIVFNTSIAYNDDKNPGTKISILIPLNLYESWLKVQSK